MPREEVRHVTVKLEWMRHQIVCFSQHDAAVSHENDKTNGSWRRFSNNNNNNLFYL